MLYDEVLHRGYDFGRCCSYGLFISFVIYFVILMHGLASLMLSIETCCSLLEKSSLHEELGSKLDIIGYH
uniref:Uncharacterized protein n=1 Tax=Rhizophora mucronata TaxID=61149 RepID=A0A2P2Q1P3_RHIMU